MGIIGKCLLAIISCSYLQLTPPGADLQLYAVCPDELEPSQYDVSVVSANHLLVKHEYDHPGISYVEEFFVMCPQNGS